MAAPAPCLAPTVGAEPRLRVLLIHQAFCGPNDAGGTRHYELGKRLIEFGLSFAVVTSATSYLTGEEREINEIPNFEVRVARTLGGWHRSYWQRVCVFISFTMSSFVSSMRVESVDLVLGSSPPLFQAISAWMVAAIRRKHFVLEVRDLWLEFAVELGLLKSRALVAAARAVEGFLYRQADHIIVNSPAYREYLIAKDIPRTKISVVANGVDIRMFHLETNGRNFRREHALDEKFVVMYAGAVGMANDVDCLLRAANRLRSESGVVFAIVGAGKELPRLQHQATAMRLENVCFIAPQPKQRMPEVLGAADVCVATLKNIPMFRTTYPNKVFDYMAAGKPTVLAIDGVIREVIEKSRGGLFVQPGDDEALAQAVLKLRRSPGLRQHMGASAQAYVEGHFSRDVQAVEFARVLERVCAD